METNSNKTIFLSELCSKAEQRSTSLPVPSESIHSAIQRSPDKVTATSPLMEKNDSFMGGSWLFGSPCT